MTAGEEGLDSPNPCRVCTQWRHGAHPSDLALCRANALVHANGTAGVACYPVNEHGVCDWDWSLLVCPRAARTAGAAPQL